MKLESAEILEEKGVSYRLIELREKAFSVKDVIEYSKDKLDPEEICKTIILKDEKGNKYAIVLLGNHRISFSKAKRFIGSGITILKPEEVKQTTEIEVGAICPILLRMPIFVDKRVFEKEKINFGSGNHLYGLEVFTKDLGKAINFRIVDAAQI